MQRCGPYLRGILFAAGLGGHLSADFSQGFTSLFEVEVIGAGQ